MLIHNRTWKDMSLDDKITEFQRSMLAVWDYPVTDKWTRMWQAIGGASAPMSMEEALVRVRREDEEFALLGERIFINSHIS